MPSSGLIADLDYSTDTIPVRQNLQVTVQPEGVVKNLKVRQELTLDQFRQRVMTDPAGLQEVRIDQTFDLTTLGAAFVNICTIPTGSKVRLAALQILTTVVVASTGDSLGIGTNGTTPALLLQGAVNLAKNYKITSIPADANGIIIGSTAIDLCATKNSDGTLSSSNITAGKVRVLLVYDKPVVLGDI